MDYVTLEFHYGPNNFISASTRNKCAYNSVEILDHISRILNLQNDFDIVFIPAQPGSYRDVLRVIRKTGITANQVTAATTLCILGIAYLTYRDSHQQSLHEQKMWVVDDTKKCLDLEEALNKLSETYDIKNVLENDIKEVCSSITLQKKKNDFYQTLMQDQNIKDFEASILNQDGLRIDHKQLSAEEFTDLIEVISDREYDVDKLSGVFEIVSPVLQQKKEGPGIPWRSIYYGNDLIQDGIKILQNGDMIDFYMQDPDFKGQILSEERAFKHGDNMEALFKVKFQLRGRDILNKSIYIEKVVKYNTDMIPHKEKLARDKKNNIDSIQKSSLFEGLKF